MSSSQVFVNDKRVTTAAYRNTEDGFVITTAGVSTQMLVPAIGAKVTFAGMIFSITLDFAKFHGNTQGQCGQCLSVCLSVTLTQGLCCQCLSVCLKS